MSFPSLLVMIRFVLERIMSRLSFDVTKEAARVRARDFFSEKLRFEKRFIDAVVRISRPRCRVVGVVSKPRLVQMLLSNCGRCGCRCNILRGVSRRRRRVENVVSGVRRGGRGIIENIERREINV